MSQNIVKLNELGLAINNTHNSIEIHWLSMQELKPNDTKSLLLYAEYTYEVLNNQEKGMEYLSLWRERVDKKEGLTSFLCVELDETLINTIKESNSIILCSAEESNFGRVIQVTKNVCTAFCYSTKELLSDFYLGNLFLPFYQKKILPWVQHQMMINSEGISHQIFFAGKTKYNRTIPLQLQIQECKGSKYFFVIVSPIQPRHSEYKNYVNTAYYIVDSTLKLISMNNFGYDIICKLNRQFTTEGLTILSDLFPELIEREYDYEFNGELNGETQKSSKLLSYLTNNKLLILNNKY